MAEYEGFVDSVQDGRASGWAYNPEHPDDPVEIEVRRGDRVLGRTTADGYRDDLRAAGKGNGRHGFEIAWPVDDAATAANRPSIRVRGQDRPLIGSPCSAPATEEPPVSIAAEANMPSFADLSEPLDDGDLPAPDRLSVPETDLTDRQRQWRRQGYLRLNNFLPHDLLDRYAEVRWRLRPSLRSWRCPVPFLHVPEMRDLALYPPLVAVLDELIGTRMALNLALTGWRSTERAWHQDDYLNPPTINGWYLAAWIAVDDIPADSGPFEFVPGSHRWPLLRSDKVTAYLPAEQRATPRWPQDSEHFVEPACAAEIARRNGAIERFTARKGDVLIWHSRLMHRGGTPSNPKAVRKSLITHYTAHDRQPAWPAPVQHGTAGWYFPIPGHPLDELAPEDRIHGARP